jgi:Domain of unknown function (DUF6504)
MGASRALLLRAERELTKRYDEPIEVTHDGIAPAAPIAFAWRGRHYEVDQLLSSWREAGEWWDRSRAHDREYHRVLARPAGALATGDLDADGFMRSPGAVYDVYNDRARGGWRLARIWD